MAAHSDGALDIWATEFGYPTGGPRAVNEHRQAAYVKPALNIWYGRSFAGPLLWYSGRDTGTSTGDREQHFGLLRYDGSAKRAYAAVAAKLTR
jgi:polysaccharide biosynthesis protein PslG